MKKTFTKFAISLVASIGLLSVGAMGLAGASSITNTGPGSVNVIHGSTGSIDTTGPGSTNVIGNGCDKSCGGGCNNTCDPKPCVKDCGEVPVPPKPCSNSCNSCAGKCDTKDDCVKPPKEKDCDKPKPVVKEKHHYKWCWKLCGHTYKWCQVQVS